MNVTYEVRNVAGVMLEGRDKVGPISLWEVNRITGANKLLAHIHVNVPKPEVDSIVDVCTIPPIERIVWNSDLMPLRANTFNIISYEADETGSIHEQIRYCSIEGIELRNYAENIRSIVQPRHKTNHYIFCLEDYLRELIWMKRRDLIVNRQVF